jgi:hypothetical protein
MKMDRVRWLALRSALSVAVALAAYLVWGYSYGILTNEFHSAIALRLSGNALFQGDSMASTLDGYASPLWVLVGWLAGFVHIRPVFLAGFLAARALFAWAMGSLASAFAGDKGFGREAWVVGAFSTLAMGWMVALPVGGDPLFGPYFSQTFLSVGMIALSIAMALRGNTVVSAAFLGIATDCNIMQSFFGAGIVGLLWLDSSRPFRRASVGRLARALLVSTVLALPALLMTAHAMTSHVGADAWMGQKLSNWARFWLRGHFFADGRSLWQFSSMVALLTTPGLLLVGRDGMHRFRPLVFAAMLYPAFLAAVEILSVDRFPSRLLFQLHLFRSDVFAYCICVGCAIAIAVDSRGKGARAAILPMAMVVSSLDGNHVQAMLLAIAFLAGTRPSSGLRTIVRTALLCGVAAFTVWTMVHGMRVSGIVGLVGLVGALPTKPSVWSGRMAVPLAVLLVALLVQSTVSFLKKEWAGKNFAVKHGDDSCIARQLKAFGKSSRRDAVFLLPPSVNARPFLERGVWFNFYDGAAFLWKPGAEVETVRRMRILGIRYEPGQTVDPDTMDAQWYAGLCHSIPVVAAEGVTRVILPDPMDANGHWTMADPTSALKILGCPEAGPGSPRG